MWYAPVTLPQTRLNYVHMRSVEIKATTCLKKQSGPPGIPVQRLLIGPSLVALACLSLPLLWAASALRCSRGRWCPMCLCTVSRYQHFIYFGPLWLLVAVGRQNPALKYGLLESTGAAAVGRHNRPSNTASYEPSLLNRAGPQHSTGRLC